ncbi:T9SS type A sorting domain-containing protein [Winogradskyella sp.]|jgi:hypothetical protein|uniref:T9SS type A sorting domain-containing protein n=1 Tax=Winogradskyella sp. TaxID=1883156 RepID=UPI0025D86DDF|nr:T9SS type A sorting domain-containing protein [Winogradskyella sp.]MCT4630516.1 T9SS type A sorting domain-containing protein [Winogradskyella sp.]
MVKILKTLFFVFFCFNINAQIINIPDTNFKAKLLEADSGVPIVYGNFPNGGSFKLDANGNGEIEVEEALLVGSLNIRNAGISDLTGIEYFTNMHELRCEENQLITLDVSMLFSLVELGVYSNSLTNLNITGLSNLEDLYANDNALSSIDLSGLSSLGDIRLEDNQLLTVDFSDCSNLGYINCDNNLLTSIDVSSIPALYRLRCASNQLETLNVKNNHEEYFIDFSDNENLQYICADDVQITQIEDQINFYDYVNCFTNSLCAFDENDDFYIVSGTIKYDEYSDGCDLDDVNYPNLLFEYTNGSYIGNIYADDSGDFNSSFQSGSYTFTPLLENSEYFSIIPNNFTLTFPEDIAISEQDFCVTANGSYPDLEITMTGEEYGYDSHVLYQITYRNNGTMTQSGTISVVYDDPLAILVSSQPEILSQNGTQLTWDFTDLKPFESRTIDFTMDLVNIEVNQDFNSIVVYNVSINSNLVDYTPDNNIFEWSEPYCGCLLNTEAYEFSDYFNLFPNPTHEFLNIKLKKDITIESLTIYNLLGQSIIKTNDFSKGIQLNVSNIKSGQYIIRIVTDSVIFASRFMKN